MPEPYPTDPITPDAVTEHYGIPLWGADQFADVERTVNETARAADAAIHAGVAAAELAAARVEAAERHATFMLMGA